MKRGLLTLILLLLPAAALAQNFDARPVTADEIAVLLPQICQAPKIAKSGSYDCQAMTGHPGDAGTAEDAPYHFTPTTILYGHLTSPTASQAYLAYHGDFEGHADDFGGGILFELGPAGWRLVRWYPGLAADHCLSLNPTGQATLLCLWGFFNMGTALTNLDLFTIPPAYDASNNYENDIHSILAGEDDTQSETPNLQCADLKPGADNILVGIDSLTRARDAGVTARAKIEFFAAPEARAACTRNDLAHAHITTATLRLTWRNNQLTIAPAYAFAPVPQ